MSDNLRMVRLRERDYGAAGGPVVYVNPASVVALRENHDGSVTYVDFGGDEASGYVVEGSPREVAEALGFEVTE